MPRFKCSQVLVRASRNSNLTQTEQAVASGFPAQSSLSAVLTGEPFAGKTRSYVIRLAQLLGVDPEKATVTIR